MAGSEQNASSSLSLSNDMTRGRCTQDAILSNQKFLHTIRSPDSRNQLYGLRVIKSPIPSDNQKATLDSLGDRQEDAGDEGLGVIWLLEDGDFLAKT